jgi:hypothetical protein
MTKQVKVGISKANMQGVDSLRFFPVTTKPSYHKFTAAITSRPVSKDTINEFYSFQIKPNEETLLMPLTIVTLINYVIVDKDTTFFYQPKNRKDIKRFDKIGMFKYVTPIQ